jgi:hypothetical protein
MSQAWTKGTDQLNLKPRFCSPYYPHGDGISERAIQTLNQKMRCLYWQHPEKDEKEKIRLATEAINNSIHTATNDTPNRIIEGAMKENTNYINGIKERITQSHKQTKKTHDQKTKQTEIIEPGEQILINGKTFFRDKQHKFSERYVGPYKINSLIGPKRYEVETETGHKTIINSYHIKNYFEPET